jgi:putative two-component system response regulator
MARVLLLGDDKERISGVRSLLRQDRHHVHWVREVDTWQEREREYQPELVIAAVGSVESVLAGARRSGSGFQAPVLIVHQETDFFSEPHIEERLVDSLASPFMGDELLARVDALVRVRRIVRREALGAQREAGLRGTLSRWFRSTLPRDERPQGPYLEVATRVAEWADRRDAFEPGHAERVTSLCARIAEGLEMDEGETSELLRAAMLHDIGKIAMPVEVLHQRAPLEDGQRRLIKTHPSRGAALLRALDPDENVARVVLYHHERPDGTGYYGKQPDAVPRAAFVLGVAEAFDAMTSSLLWERLKPEEAIERLQSTRGSAYDDPLSTGRL